MLEFMRALEAQSLRLYDNKCFGSYDVLEQVRASNIKAIAARLRPHYPHTQISIQCVGLRLRIIGDASSAQNDGFYCHFRIHPSDGFRTVHYETLSVMDLSGAGWVDVSPSQIQLSRVHNF